MRESIGSTWIYSLVITFTLIFAGFLVLAISYSKTYKLKNEITTIVEKYNGFTSDSTKIINDYLYNSGYTSTSKCKQGTFGTKNFDDTVLDSVDSNDDYYYCVNYNKNENTGKSLIEITLFYDFNLPILGKIATFRVTGKTNEIYYATINNKKV